MELIDKEKVCKEIKRLIDNTTSERGDDVSDSYQKTGAYFVLNKLLHYIDTLESKDVDLDKESMNYLLNEHKSPLTKVMHGVDLGTEMQYHKDIQDAFKAGFKKAMEAKQLPDKVVDAIDAYLESLKEGKPYDKRR